MPEITDRDVDEQEAQLLIAALQAHLDGLNEKLNSVVPITLKDFNRFYNIFNQGDLVVQGKSPAYWFEFFKLAMVPQELKDLVASLDLKGGLDEVVQTIASKNDKLIGFVRQNALDDDEETVKQRTEFVAEVLNLFLTSAEGMSILEYVSEADTDDELELSQLFYGLEMDDFDEVFGVFLKSQ